MKLLILGKNSYVGVSVKNYIEKHHSDMSVTMASSRDGVWKDINFAKYDAVYNVSGLCHADSKHGTPEQYMSINGQLPIDMGEKAKIDGCKLFINMSSSIIYGNMSFIGEDKTMDRDTVPAPVNVYGESKLFAEKGLLKLEDQNFSVALIRAPLIYGENSTGNFPLLVKFARKSPIFPDIKNQQSMIYIDNLCELIYLIVKHQQGGIYLPQDPEIKCTSQLVKDMAALCNHKIVMTKAFNPILKVLGKKIYYIDKAFGNIAYTKEASNQFDYAYQVIGYEESLKRVMSKL
ncbi:MAG: NAD-dependent epimerase/dehydratase family protein [Oscillospiraceae bacterium]